MLDQRTIHTIGTLSIASGVALFVLSIPAILLASADLVARTTSLEEAVAVLSNSIPANGFVLGTPQTTFTLGLVGLGVSCWLLGIGLLLQGRTEA
ncbi:hypothetical protein [Haladaptatus caseinilyticus]|uniref:hypothetical protein n=1 Tax=Haladaptatus caseinilyticus TaxID=2993314 RepID=UPI00224A8630|nr:hypothetical protein [Haladaptatus caseinilyticus]